MFGGSTTSPSCHSKDKNQSACAEDLSSALQENDKEAFGEWLAQNINVVKSFHVNVRICIRPGFV